MCSPSNIYQLISTWADVAAVDGITEGIRGGVSSFVGMCASQIQQMQHYKKDEVHQIQRLKKANFIKFIKFPA